MGSLEELAQEYLANAKEIEKQIDEFEKKIPFISETWKLIETEKKIKTLMDMHSEQMTTYYQLRNYYNRKD